MISRDAATTLRELAKGFPIVGITGPRQSGKATMARAVFAGKPYVSLENPDVRELATDDPRAFLSRYREGAVLDEAQRAPALFSYLQSRVDETGSPGQFVLTGSQQFGMVSAITQSLAGRVALLRAAAMLTVRAARRRPCSGVGGRAAMAGWLSAHARQARGSRNLVQELRPDVSRARRPAVDPDPGPDAVSEISAAVRGPLFETWVVSEYLKARFNRGLLSNLTFWRDRRGREIDLPLERGGRLQPVDIKAGATLGGDAFRGLELWRELVGDAAVEPQLVYAGDDPQERRGIAVHLWRDLAHAVNETP